MNSTQISLVEDAIDSFDDLDEKEQDFICQLQAKVEDGSAKHYELTRNQAFFLLKISEKT